VRRLSAVALTVASCAAIVGAWRIGDGSHQSTVVSGPVLPPPSAGSSAASPNASTPNAPSGSASKHPHSSTSATPSAGTRSFAGGVAQTQYGDVQVRIVMTGNRLTGVTALHLTDSSSRSVSISAHAAPILRQEALAAGSAKIDTVSGASYTSQGYIQSLQSALDAARAGG
jgi:uncharacterized protein with FMN-binding domain